MTTFVLVVEDDEAFAASVTQVLWESDSAVEISYAKSRTSAIALLENNFFDLIILDLNIPTVDKALDAKPQNGHAVFARAQTAAPGTPVLVLTSSTVEDFVDQLLQRQHQCDVWGEGHKIGTIQVLKKNNFVQCASIVGPILQAISALSDVELEKSNVHLSTAQDRLLRIFAKLFSGTRARVTKVGGGLSGALVVRIAITNSAGARVHDAVAKLSTMDDVKDEGERFEKMVSRLDPIATPRKLATLEYGAGATAGIFYGLADGFEDSAFKAASDITAGSFIGNVANVTSKWNEGVPETRRTIREIRSRVLKDGDLEVLIERYSLAWIPTFEQREIQTRWACCHGDLHGENVLVSAIGDAVIIDYGDVGDGPASLDPCTLELSVLFHPEGPLRDSEWPSTEAAHEWGNLDVYLTGCPIPEFIRACRKWALTSGAGQREIAACAYAYLVRQLKYEDTDKELILALLQGVRRYFDAT